METQQDGGVGEKAASCGKGISNGFQGSLIQTANAGAQQEIRCDIQRHAIKQVTHVDRRAIARDMFQERVGPATEDFEIPDALPRKHGSDQCTAGLPLLAVGGEDAVTEEALPYLVELRALAKLGELAGQDGLDVLSIAGDDDAAAQDGHFDGVEAGGLVVAESGIEVVEEVVVYLVICSL